MKRKIVMIWKNCSYYEVRLYSEAAQQTPPFGTEGGVCLGKEFNDVEWISYDGDGFEVFDGWPR
jgi:hypothetical protein